MSDKVTRNDLLREALPFVEMACEAGPAGSGEDNCGVKRSEALRDAIYAELGEARAKRLRCEGMRRHGSAFSLGPVRWEQCKEEATVRLLLLQKDGEVEKLPACPKCWQECIDTLGIEVQGAEPIL